MKCVICGKEIERSMFSNVVLCSPECHTKHFWQEIIAGKDRYIVINGNCYYNGGEIKNPSRYQFLGHAGRRFYIRFFDGREITTNNLWHNGVVPDEFRDQLPDIAEFYWPKQIDKDKIDIY